jgi:hypothetical protein
MTAPPLPDPFPVARLRLRTRVLRRVEWPEYEGSALRGLWGHALRLQACATGQPRCAGCPLHARCNYAALFEPAPPRGSRSYGDMTPPYVIEPGCGARILEPGEAYVFDQVLFGAGLADAPRVLRAWRQALEAGRIGPAAGALRVEEACWVDALRVSTPFGTVPPMLCLPTPERMPRRWRLQLHTPLFVKRMSRPVTARDFEARDLLWAVVRRVAEVCELHLGVRTDAWNFAALKAAAEQVRFVEGFWRNEAFDRWSNRQQHHMQLRGIVGEGTFEGDLQPFAHLLYVGQWLHAGGKASFGLGRYELEPGSAMA